jgi:hypothetical protein
MPRWKHRIVVTDQEQRCTGRAGRAPKQMIAALGCTALCPVLQARQVERALQHAADGIHTLRMARVAVYANQLARELMHIWNKGAQVIDESLEHTRHAYLSRRSHTRYDGVMRPCLSRMVYASAVSATSCVLAACNKTSDDVLGPSQPARCRDTCKTSFRA